MRVAVNTVSRYGNRVFNLVVGFFLTPYLLARLGQEMLGLQVLATQALQFCLMVGTACSRGFTRFAAVHHARGDYASMNQTLGRGVTLTILMASVGVAVTLGLVALADWVLGLQGEVLRVGRWVILMVGVGYIFDQICELWGAMLFMSQRFYVQELAMLAGRLLAVTAVIIWFEWGTPSMIVWVALTVGANFLVKSLLVIPGGRRGVPQARLRPVAPGGAEFWEMTRFSVASLVAGLGFLLYYGSNSIIISNVDELGAGKIMAYNLGQRWDPMVRDIVLALASTLTPVFTSLYAQGALGELRSAFLRTTRHSLLVGMFPCVLMLIFAEPFMGLWVGQEYVADSARVLKISMVNVLISVPAIVGFEALLGMGRISGVAWMTVFGGTANIVLAILLVKVWHFGLAGIALATLVTWGLVTCFYIVGLVVNALGISLKELGRESLLRPFLASVPLAAVSWAMIVWHRPDQRLTLLVEWTVAGLVYLGAVYGLGLTPGERTAMARIARAKWEQLGARWGAQPRRKLET